MICVSISPKQGFRSDPHIRLMIQRWSADSIGTKYPSESRLQQLLGPVLFAKRVQMPIIGKNPDYSSGELSARPD